MSVCEYKIYPTSSEKAEKLDEFCTELNIRALSIYAKYIWHQEPFCVWVEGNHLAGKTTVGDCVDDEWFIVYILKQLSLYFGIVCSCSDEDGEFLLIEVAELLPGHVEPSTSENKVFLYKGKLHLVPNSVNSLAEASDLIKRDSKSTVLSNEIQSAINKRCSSEIFNRQIHRAKVFVPHLAGHILTLYPELVSPAVEAFYSRDPVSSKAIANMEKFPPSSNVAMTVSFTKIRYSQLKCSQFIPPAQFILPPMNDPQHQAADLGMKLACGFEILYSSLKKEDRTDESFHIPVEVNQKLMESGYYDKQPEMSNLFQRLEASAIQSISSQSAQSHIPYLLIKFKRLCSEENLMDQSYFSQVSPDSDSWMMIDVEEVDVILDDKVKNLEFSSDSDFLSDLDEEELKEMKEMKGIVSGFQEFIGKNSGIGGAIFPNQPDSDSDSEDDDYKPISFDADVYLHKISKGYEISENTVEVDPPKQESMEIEALMDAMDSELNKTALRDDFERDEDDNVDADLTLLKNVLKSVDAQGGSAGPASNIITSLGLNFPRSEAL